MSAAMQRIAMIDDHVILRKGLARIIEQFEGFSVVLQADNGADFSRLVDLSAPPQIILLDIHMPFMNGYSTMEWVRQHLPGAKVLVLSMVESELAIIGMIRLGASGYILKDSLPDQFYKALVSLRDDGVFINQDLPDAARNLLQEEAGPYRKKHAAAGKQPFLTALEREFLEWACTELTYRDIAVKMGASLRAIDGYRDSLFQKLGVNSRVGLVLYAVKYGIVVM